MLSLAVDDYHRLCREREEWAAHTNLIDGIVYASDETDRHRNHDNAVATIRNALHFTHPSLAIYTRVRLRYDGHCSLVADLAVFRHDPHPVPHEEPVRGDQQWAIDIFHAESVDFTPMLKVYARNEIPEYWLIDWDNGYIDRHTQPHDEQYTLVVRTPITQIVKMLPTWATTA